MLKLIIGIFLLLMLASFLSPATREFLNERVQSIFFREAKERAKERQLVGSVDVYSPRVEEIQEILKGAGISCGPIDGRMGGQTRKAIREFQEAKGIKVNGIVNQETWLELNREKAALVNLKKKEKTEEPIVSPVEERPQEIKPELPKDRIKQIQLALKKAGFNPGSIDGRIGKKTRKAIREFQKAKGLKVDSVVGEETWQELMKYLR